MLKGVLAIWSETGTEGPVWVFQHDKYMAPDGWSFNGMYPIKKGHFIRVYDKADSTTVLFAGSVVKSDDQYTRRPVFEDQDTGKIIDTAISDAWFDREHPSELDVIERDPIC